LSLHDRDGTLADERDRHRVGAHALARDAAGGVGGVTANASGREKWLMGAQFNEHSDEIILVEPGGAWRPDELDELAQSIRGVSRLNVRSAAPREQRGRGLTWWEIVHIWLPWAAMGAGGVAGSAMAKKIVDVAVEWARARFARKTNRRPTYVAIYGPDGKVVKSALISDGTAPPEDRTATDAASPPRQRPSLSED
jgi:hypothetical protein